MRAFRWYLVLLGLLGTAALADGVTLPAFERVVLDNGTVLLLNEKHDVPLVGLEAVVRGGAVADPAGKYGLANLLANLLEKGAGSRSSAEFAEAIAAVGGELSASADLESISVSAEFMARRPVFPSPTPPGRQKGVRIADFAGLWVNAPKGAVG